MPSRIDVSLSLGAQRSTRPPSKVPAGRRAAVAEAERAETERVREEMRRLREEMYARNPHLRSDAA